MSLRSKTITATLVKIPRISAVCFVVICTCLLFTACQSELAPQQDLTINPFDNAGIAHNEALLLLMSSNSNQESQHRKILLEYVEKNYPNQFQKPDIFVQSIRANKTAFTPPQMKLLVKEMPLNSKNKEVLLSSIDFIHYLQSENLSVSPEIARERIGQFIKQIRQNQCKNSKDSIEQAYVLSALAVGQHSYEFWHKFFSANGQISTVYNKGASALQDNGCQHAVLEADFHGALISTALWAPWLFGNLAAGNITPMGLALSFAGRAGAVAAHDSYIAYQQLIVCR